MSSERLQIGLTEELILYYSAKDNPEEVEEFDITIIPEEEYPKLKVYNCNQ